MNKVLLMGRLVRNPELRYSQGSNPLAVCRYTLAVARRYKQQGQPEADFIECVTFGKSAEFAIKYFFKGQQIAVTGRLQTSSCEDKTGVKRKKAEILVEEQYFAEGKRQEQTEENGVPEGFHEVDDADDDLPF